MLRIVAQEQGDTQTLGELVDWLVEQQAWSVIDDVARRFDDQFKQDPFLMYTLAQARLAQVVDRARAGNLQAAGMTGDPDPYTATMNALELFDVDDVVISTYSETRSGWLRADLIARTRKSSQKPVKHIVAQPEDAQVTA